MLEKIASYHNCYKSRLTVMAADTGDSKTYQVHVQNDHGAETHSLELRVHGEAFSIKIKCHLLLLTTG